MITFKVKILSMSAADSPDSNSCQDGGYNLGPSSHVVEIPDRQQQKPAPSSPEKSVGTEPSPGRVDRSFQTGTALSHTDQWVQTSPAPTETSRVGASAADVSFREDNTKLKSPLIADQAQQSRPWSSNQLRSPGKYPNLVPAHRARNSHVHFADNSNDLGHRSLTDDAKGIQPLSAGSWHNEDYFNCNPGALFDEDNFDIRAHDRASSARLYARSSDSPKQKTSESSTNLSSSSSTVHTNCARSSAHSPITLTQREEESNHSGFPDASKSGEKYACTKNGPNGHQEDIDSALDQNVGKIIGDVIDFNNHRSFVSPDSKAGLVKGKTFGSQSEKSLLKGLGGGNRREKTAESELDNRSEEREDQRSRRNSWADELEQYRVHGKEIFLIKSFKDEKVVIIL